MHRRCHLVVLLAIIVSPLLGPSTARATDVGEIVVIEDVGGVISAGGLLPQVYVSKAACAFFKLHPDSYDVLVFFSAVPLNMLNASPMGWPVKPPAKGIGLDVWPDQSAAFCATNNRLRHAIRMGDLAQLPDNPDDLYAQCPSTFKGIEILAHELGHQWMALVNFTLPDGTKHCQLRAFSSSAGGSGTDCDGHSVSDFNQHWSFYFNNPSMMYGSEIKDLGGGAFQMVHAPKVFTPLDQYLMGLRAKTDVPPMFVVDLGDPASGFPTTPPLLPGKTQDVKGKRLGFTIDDVIRSEGPRVPASEGCHLKAAFALIHAEGTPPTSQQIAKVEAYRTRLEAFYPWATGDRASIDTTLAGTGAGTKGCPPSGIQPDAGASLPDAAPSDLSADSAIAPDAGVNESGVSADAAHAGDGESGCGCTLGRAATPKHGWLLLLLLLGVLPRRRL